MSQNGLSLYLQQGAKRYNRNWIFRKLDLKLEQGDLLAIAGPNGSGKSTLLQCLMGYQSLSEGSLRYELAGKTIAEENRYAHISLVSPYLELPEGYTLKELLDFHFGLKAMSPNCDLTEMLEASKLDAHLNKQIIYFSSGMKQRAKLILGFASDSPLLFLDEPTTNLDQAGFDWFDTLITQSSAAHRILVIASNQAHETKCCNKLLNISDYK